MIQPAQYRRLALMALLLLIAFAGLGYRLVDLQVLRHEDLSREATFTRERTIIRASRRGDILDARGDVLATTLFVKTVFADPSLIGTNQALVARTLAPVLRINETELAQKLRRTAWTDKEGQQRTGLSVAAWRAEKLGQIGRNKSPKLKAPPEGNHPAPPSAGGGSAVAAQRDWQRPSAPDDMIPF